MRGKGPGVCVGGPRGGDGVCVNTAAMAGYAGRGQAMGGYTGQGQARRRGRTDLGLLALGSDPLGLGRASLFERGHVVGEAGQLQSHHALLVAGYVLLPLPLILRHLLCFLQQSMSEGVSLLYCQV